eukprot:c18612_g1_i1 orf=298-1437(-)
MDLESVRDAHDRVYKKQKLCETQSEDVISRIIHEINLATNKLSAEAEAIQARQILSDLRSTLSEIGPMKQVGSTQKDVNLALMKYGKVLDKLFRADLASALMEIDFDMQVINKIVALHFFRLGQFELGEGFMQETQEADLSLKTAFYEMHHILEQVNLRNLEPALEWVKTHHKELQLKGSSLEFNLHELQFVQLLQQGSRFQALQYAKANFFQFATSHMGKIQRLMGSLLWAGRLEHSPYRDLWQPTNWELISIQFTRECCNLIGYSYQSALQVIVSAGTQALPTLLKMVSIFGNKKHEWLALKQLPLEVELDKEYQFHSIFACPVSKEQSSAENPPMLMPCGHVLCKQSLQRLSKSRNFKCPYCPTEVNMLLCKPIIF